MTEFAKALAELLLDDGRSRRNMQRRAMAGLDPTPEQAALYAAGGQEREARGDNLAAVTGIPGTLQSYQDFAREPSIPNATDAAARTALMAFRPGAALKSLLLGYGAAGVGDLGGYGMTAQASQGAARDPLDPGSRKRLEQLQAKQNKGERLTRAEREEQQQYISVLGDASRREAEVRAQAEAQKNAQSQEEYNRRVQKAEAVRDELLARNRRFSDTEIGKVWEKTGALTPALVGFGTGMLGRAVSGGGSAMKNYILPGAEGALAGALSANIPLGADAFFTDRDNPEKAAYSAYARELPETHPRRAEWADYARQLPDRNPVNEKAGEDFFDTTKAAKRMGFGLAEGLMGGLAGANAVRLPGAMLEAASQAPWRAIGAYRNARANATAGGSGSGGPAGNPAAPFGDWATYPPVGSPQRDAIRDAYRDAVLAAGSPLNPSVTNRVIQKEVAASGGSLPNVTKRVKGTNENYVDFVKTHGRPPISEQEWANHVFKATGTLGLTGAAALSADDELKRILGLE